jgi:hypothetical protein
MEANGAPLTSSTEIRDATWIQARSADNVPIDSIEWNVDGKVTQVTSEPFAILLDPEQLGDGPHDVTARITSQGRVGPFFASSVVVPPDIFRSVRTGVRAWGLIVLLLVGNAIVLTLFLRRGFVASGGAVTTEFPPMLRLNRVGDRSRFVAPELIVFPARGKLRIGYHPPYMDNTVGSREFSKLPYQDIRGDEDAVKDLSRHAACIWRDPKTNDCYIQLGWPGRPGEPIKPKPQSGVLHFGRPQSAATQPFRLAHHDVVRLASGVEYLFSQVGLRDKATPESKKASPFEVRAPGGQRTIAVLTDGARQHAVGNPETIAEEG